MSWIGANTPKEGHFLVLSGIEGAGSDLISEWFPALSDRSSLNTPAGHRMAGWEGICPPLEPSSPPPVLHVP